MTRFFLLTQFILCIAITLIGVHLKRIPHGDLWIDFLDIGQGDSVLITTPEGNHILVDGGPGQDVLQELGETLPFWQRNIDLMILSHPHADHMSGLIPVLDRYEVKAVLISGANYESALYESFLMKIREKEIPLYVAQADQDWRFGEVTIDILYPFESILGESFDNVNNASVVCKIEYRGQRLLLSGDAETEVEEMLISTDIDFSAEIFKAGHHGSRTSSSLEFLERIHPQIVVIQSGEDNSFGHPHPETLAHFMQLGIVLYRNDLEGRIHLVFEGIPPP